MVNALRGDVLVKEVPLRVSFLGLDRNDYFLAMRSNTKHVNRNVNKTSVRQLSIIVCFSLAQCIIYAGLHAKFTQ